MMRCLVSRRWAVSRTPDRPLVIGDLALACTMVAEHRREAFAACADPGGRRESSAPDLEAPDLHRRVGQLSIVNLTVCHTSHSV